MVGDDRASRLYVSLKEKKAREIGFYFEKHLFPAGTKTEEIINLIKSFNDRSDIHGILVQLPLPAHVDASTVIANISTSKDADGFHEETIKKFLGGDEKSMPVFPQAIVEMIKESGVSFVNKKAVLVVNSVLFGSVLKKVLEKYGLVVRVVQSAEITKDTNLLKEADVVVTTIGKNGIITGDMVKQGSLIIDGGTSGLEGKTVGDIDVQSMENLDVILTPVPGGVGPITVACLLRNVVRLTGIAL